MLLKVLASAALSVLAELTQNRIRGFFHLPPVKVQGDEALTIPGILPKDDTLPGIVVYRL